MIACGLASLFFDTTCHNSSHFCTLCNAGDLFWVACKSSRLFPPVLLFMKFPLFKLIRNYFKIKILLSHLNQPLLKFYIKKKLLPLKTVKINKQFFLFAYSLANTTSHKIRTKQLIYLLSFVPILISIQQLIKRL